jgi:hypothetical protein
VVAAVEQDHQVSPRRTQVVGVGQEEAAAKRIERSVLDMVVLRELDLGGDVMVDAKMMSMQEATVTHTNQ